MKQDKLQENNRKRPFLVEDWRRLDDMYGAKSTTNGGDVIDVISTNEGISVLVFQLTILILFCLFKCNIHKP